MAQPQPQPVFVAGMWHRLAAALIDAVILAPILALAGLVAFRLGGVSFRLSGLFELVLGGGIPFYGVVVVAALLLLLYGVLFSTLSGATPGKLLLGLRLINLYGERPELWRIAVRAFGTLLSLALLCLGLLWIAFDRHKQGLHDRLAGIYVVRARRGQAALPSEQV